MYSEPKNRNQLTKYIPNLGQALDLNKLREVAAIMEEETIAINAEEAQKGQNDKLEEMKQKGRRYDPKKIKKKAAAKVIVKKV